MNISSLLFLLSNLPFLLSMIILKPSTTSARHSSAIEQEDQVASGQELQRQQDIGVGTVGSGRPPVTLQDFKHRHNKGGEVFPKIVGGREVKPKFLHSPWLGALRKGDYQFCAGSMFGKNLLVTAAHCSVLDIPLEELNVAIHRHDLSLPDDAEDAIILKVRKITVHPEFNYYTLSHDIAVWHLEGGDDLPDNRVVRLDNGKNSWPGRNCSVIGWGATDEMGDASDVLLMVSLPIVEQEFCRDALGGRITDSMICAGGQMGRDACQGDSGGPMIVMRFYDRPVLVGVVSWGRGCAREGYPGVYTRVSMFRTWLRDFLSIEEKIAMDAEDALINGRF